MTVTSGTTSSSSLGHTSEMTRVVRATPHVAGLVVGVVASVIAGQPYGWVGFLLPIGPLAFVVVDRPAPEPTRQALAFSLVGAALIGGGWTITWLRAVTSIAACLAAATALCIF